MLISFYLLFNIKSNGALKKNVVDIEMLKLFKMLKLLSTVFLLTIFNTSLFSQNIIHENKIKEYLGNDRFRDCQRNNPGLIEYLDIKVEKGYAIEELSEGKVDDFTEISFVTYSAYEKGEQISVEDFLNHSQQEDFNILFYQFPMPKNGGNGHFLLSGTDKVISIYSSQYLNKQL